MLVEGHVASEAEMKELGKQPDYTPVQVQTAEGMLETWQMLPTPKDYVEVKEEAEQAAEQVAEQPENQNEKQDEGIIKLHPKDPEQQRKAA